LLKREGEIFTEFSQEHENQFHHICQHLRENTLPSGYSEYLTNAVAPPVAINHFKHKTLLTAVSGVLNTCTICNLQFPEIQTDICPGCGARARHRQVVDVLGKIGNPFDDQRVLACYANSVEKISILSGAKEVRNFDIRPVTETDFQMDIQHMDSIADDSFDRFIALHVLQHVSDDHQAMREIYRILKPGGMALLTIPYRTEGKTTERENVLEHYGAENYEKYGVGSYRMYGLNDVICLFSDAFDLKIIDGFDEISRQSMNVFLLTKCEN
jgi:SAM-dependent methyltransferase